MPLIHLTSDHVLKVMVRNDSGITRDAPVKGTDALIVASFLSTALYNFIELNFIILTTFKRRHGLYFWSFVVATWGIPPYAIGFLLKNFLPRMNSYVYVTLIVVGWWSLVTGQSMVLYSRLHLILQKPTWLRAVLYMIIIDAIICYVPTTVMVYGANSATPDPFVKPYSIYEKVQVTIFFLQEIVISLLYIFASAKLWRFAAVTGRDSSREIMRHLIGVSLLVVILDITILAFEYADLYYLQTSYKGLAYSVKLKLEFSILNRLVDVTQSRKGSSFARTTGSSGIADSRRPSDGPRQWQFGF
ncbi:hypothetical protein ACJ41O_005789 [Fusarium nematophilum]